MSVSTKYLQQRYVNSFSGTTSKFADPVFLSVPLIVVEHILELIDSVINLIFFFFLQFSDNTSDKTSKMSEKPNTYQLDKDTGNLKYTGKKLFDF